jgi:RNA-binding protein 5/10
VYIYELVPFFSFSLVQCNEPRTDDAPAADISLSNSTSLGKKGLEAG